VAAISARSVIIDGEAVFYIDTGVLVFDKLHSGAYAGIASPPPSSPSDLKQRE